MKPILLLVSLLLFSSAHADGVQSQTLLDSEHSWDGTPYRQYPTGTPRLRVLKITVPPHTRLPWHRHPMPNAGYLLAGSITVEKEDGRQQRLQQGEVLAEMVDTRHRGVTGDDGAVLIVFYAGSGELPLSQP